MEDHVVDFVVAVHEGAAVARLGVVLPKKGDHVVEMRDRADGPFGVDVEGLGLGGGDGAEGFDLAVVEMGGAAEGFETDGFGIDDVELSECADGVVPPVSAHR